MGWRGGGGGGLAVVLEFSGLVEFSGEGLDVAGVSVEREAGKGDGLSESVWAGLIWLGLELLLEPVRDLFGEAALLYGPCGENCSSPTGGPRMDCVEGETGF